MASSKSPPRSPNLAHRSILSPTPLSPSSNTSPRGRPPPVSSHSSSLQSRRASVAQGLGVSFASLSIQPSSNGSSGPPSPSATRPASATSRSQSRRSSIQSNPTTTSRGQSFSHLASFLAGVEHHTRVRSPGPSGGRGTSRSQSRAGEDRSFGRISRQSSQFSQSRTTSGHGTPPAHSSGLPLKREATDNPLAVYERVRNESPRPVLDSVVQQQHRFYPPPTPRLLGTEPEEEPFIDSTPSSPGAALNRRPLFTPMSPEPQRDTPQHASGPLAGVEVFQVGERVGVGVYLEGRGGWARDCFSDSPPPDPTAAPNFGAPGELEVVRKLGEGTYAVVYLVREVLYDPDPADDILSPLDSDDWNPSSPYRPRAERSWSQDPFALPSTPTYGRNFALKCLCKQDLTEELIEIQRGEAHLHRALPDHENIVRLYAAYETDDWLFLVLEYCPGQDLFYWLDERQDDHQALYDLHSRAASPFQSYSSPRRSFDESFATTATATHADESTLSRTLTAKNAFGSLTSNSDFDNTPPSPTLLSRKEDGGRKRLRLISRMFGQMCSAVQACHDRGISHRDIKPENFIVSDGRAMGDSGAGRVVVKITDWGLGTRDTECEDFDCGSKPYMAYECRNNLRPTYDPRQADVWSLGLVFLNLLYHRNPWADPSLDDPDFAEYVRDPKGFLQDRFEGMSEEVASFLTDRVFCDVLDVDRQGNPIRRVSAGEFGRWAARLVTLMGRPSSHAQGHSRLSSAEPVQPLVFASPNRSSPAPRSPQRPQASLLSQLAPPPTTSATTTDSPSVAAEPRLPKVDEVVNENPGASHNGGDRPVNSSSNSSVASSSRERPAQDDSNSSSAASSASPAHMFPCDEDNDELPSPSFPPTNSSIFQTLIPTPVPGASRADEPSPMRLPESDHPAAPSPGPSQSTKEEDARSDDEDGDLKCYSPSEASNRSKRRKRGARRGRSKHAPHATNGSSSAGELSPLSPGSPRLLATVDEQRDLVLADLAAASQDLAREISSVRKSKRSTSTQVGGGGGGSRSSSTPASPMVRPAPPLKSMSTSAAKALPSAATTSSSSGGMFSRMRSLVKDGNPDLQAFKARVEERNASLGVTSAPAKMQQSRHLDPHHGATSRGSVGTSSWGSWTGSADGGGGTTSGDDKPRSHWSSTTSRRERLDKRNKQHSSKSTIPEHDVHHHQAHHHHVGTASTSSFDSSTRSSSAMTSTSMSTGTPLSSFSSVASSSIPAAALPVKPVAASDHLNWRRASPPSSTSKPALKDAVVDTTDLASAADDVNASHITIKPVADSTAARPVSKMSNASTSTITSPVESVDAPAAAPPPQVKTKLAKMLNSISMFNRSQERSTPSPIMPSSDRS